MRPVPVPLLDDRQTPEPTDERVARLIKDGLFDKAIYACDSVIAAAQDDVGIQRAAFLSRGLAHLEIAHKAQGLIERGLSVTQGDHPDEGPYYPRLFLEYKKAMGLESALMDSEQAIALGADSGDVYFVRAAALLGVGHLDEALAACHKAIVSEPPAKPAFDLIRDILRKKQHLEVEGNNSIDVDESNTDVDLPSDTRDALGIVDYLAAYFAGARRAFEKGLSVAELDEAIDDKLAAKAAARETTGRASEPPQPQAPAPAVPRPDAAAKETTKRKRGPRVKPNPALPEKAPEIYRDRKPREELSERKENIVQFIERVYAPWRKILTRADLRRLDESADAAVERWISSKRPLPKGLLPTEFELNTDKRLIEARRREKRVSLSKLRQGASVST
jgi:tetratricopeptide (TPR) repeat protein